MPALNPDRNFNNTCSPNLRSRAVKCKYPSSAWRSHYVDFLFERCAVAPQPAFLPTVTAPLLKCIVGARNSAVTGGFDGQRRIRVWAGHEELTA